MEKKTANRSVLRTQKLLKAGLIELLSEKPLSQISVKELTARADLNRGTFYLHYKDIYDLLESIENDLLDEFEQICDEHKALEMNGNPYPLLKNLFEFIQKNANFIRIVLVDIQNPSFLTRLKKILRDRCTYEWSALFEDADAQSTRFCFTYVVSGCIGIIENWLRFDMNLSPEELARHTSYAIIHGLTGLTEMSVRD